MEDAFWTKTITPQEWLQKVKDDWPWRKQKAKLEKEFAENPENARKNLKELVQDSLTNGDLRYYWKIGHEIEPVLCKLWDEIDLTSSKLERNVIGMLAEQWLEAYDGQKVVADTPVLRTERANELWEIAKENGWVDDNLMPKLSDGKAAILASVMAAVLDLPAPIWAQFENFWNKKRLSVSLSKAKNCNYYSSLYKEIERAFR